MYRFKGSFFYPFCIIVLAAFYRLWYLPIIPSPSGDEGYWGVYALSIYKGESFVPMNVYDSRLFAILISIFYQLFGVSFFASRLLVTIIGILTVYFTYLLAKRMYNEKVGFFSSLFMAIIPFHVMWSRIAFNHIPSILMSIIGILLFFISKTSKRKYLTLFFSFLFISLGLQFSPVHIITVICIIIYLALTRQLVQLIKDKWVLVIIIICFIVSFPIIRYDICEGYFKIKEVGSGELPPINLSHLLSYFKILLGCITGENEYLHFGGYTLNNKFLLLSINLLFLCWVIAAIIFAFYRRRDADIFLLTNLCGGIIFLPVMLYATIRLWYFPIIGQERHLFILFPFICILMSNFVVEFPRKKWIKFIINGLFVFAILFHIFSLNIRYFNLFLNNGGVDNGPIRVLDGRGYRGYITSRDMIPPQEQLSQIINTDSSSYPKTVIIGDHTLYFSMRFYLQDTISIIGVTDNSISNCFDDIKNQSIYIPIWDYNLLPEKSYYWPHIRINIDLIKLIINFPKDKVKHLKTIYKPDRTPLIHLYKIVLT